MQPSDATEIVFSDPFEILGPWPKVPLPGDWATEGACKNATEDPVAGVPDSEVILRKWFFPTGRPNGRAQKVCARCPVKAECLSYAMDHFPLMQGIWGGATWMDRKLYASSPKGRMIAASNTPNWGSLLE